MALSDDYSLSTDVYDRKDFQADYNIKVFEKNYRDVTYIFKIKNNNAEVISQSSSFTAYDLEKFDENLILKVSNPITNVAKIEAMNFIITTDSVERKFRISNYNVDRYGLPREDFFSSANSSNLVFPNKTRIRVPFWQKGETLIVNTLYLTNPT